MLMSRVRRRFRYEGDPKEVTLQLSSLEARKVMLALVVIAEPVGAELAEFLQDTDDSDAIIIRGNRCPS